MLDILWNFEIGYIKRIVKYPENYIFSETFSEKKKALQIDLLKVLDKYRVGETKIFGELFWKSGL